MVTERRSTSMSQLMAVLSRGHGSCISSKYSKLLLAGLICPLLLLMLLLLRLSSPLSTFSWRHCPCECETTRAREHPELQGMARPSDVEWLLQQVQPLTTGDGAWLKPRKGINPRTRQQQLFDLRRYFSIAHQLFASMAS